MQTGKRKCAAALRNGVRRSGLGRHFATRHNTGLHLSNFGVNFWKINLQKKKDLLKWLYMISFRRRES